MAHIFVVFSVYVCSCIICMYNAHIDRLSFLLNYELYCCFVCHSSSYSIIVHGISLTEMKNRIWLYLKCNEKKASYATMNRIHSECYKQRLEQICCQRYVSPCWTMLLIKISLVLLHSFCRAFPLIIDIPHKICAYTIQLHFCWLITVH